jgi:hypothetical protein
MAARKGRRAKDGKHKNVTLDHARWQLAKIWFGLSVPLALFLVVQSVVGKYQDKVQAVWGWALPTMLPTLSLILAALGASALEPENQQTQVKRSFFVAACWLSSAYLLLVIATIAIEPFTRLESLQLMSLSNIWLGPFQGLVTSVIGVLFFTRQSDQNKPLQAEALAKNTADISDKTSSS